MAEERHSSLFFLRKKISMTLANRVHPINICQVYFTDVKVVRLPLFIFTCKYNKNDTTYSSSTSKGE
jgi:hypothetical protein